MPPTIFQSWPEYLVTCLILMLAQAVYVLFGFGAGLIAVGSLALLFPEIQDVVVMLLLVNLPAELAVVLASRRVISWRGVFRISAGVVLGIPLGTFVLSRGEPAFVLNLLGIFLLVAGSVFLLLPRDRSLKWPSWSGPPTGVVSGILTGLFGTGGPPLILYYHLGGAAKAAFRGNLMAIFLLKTFVRVPAYSVAGLVTAPRLWSSLAVLPAIACGAWLGHRIHVRLDEVTFRRLVSIMLLILGLVILLGGCSGSPEQGELFVAVPQPDLPSSSKTFGGSLLDIDRDGRLDLLVSVHGNRAEIYLNRSPLRLERWEPGSYVPLSQPDHHGSAACDYDHDGDWDVYVTVGAEHGREFGFNQLWNHSATGRFADLAAEDVMLQDPLGRARGALWADCDRDRSPELLIFNYASQARLLSLGSDGWRDATGNLPPPLPVDLWQPGQPAPGAKERSRSTWIHTAVACDLDLDGSVDLLTLGRTGGWVGLWLNDGHGRFYDATAAAGLRPAFFPHMPTHLAAGDVDSDGDPDLVFVFRPDPVVDPRRGPLELWRNESAPGRPRFVFDPTTGLTPAHDPVACLLADLDNDSHLDLYVAHRPELADQPPNLLFRGNGRGGFQEISGRWGGRGPVGGTAESAWAVDLDQDGDLDLISFHGGGEDEDPHRGIACFENLSPAATGFTVTLHSATGPPHGLGALLELALGSGRLTREVRCIANPVNATVLPVHFGVGAATGPFRLVITWPDGRQREVLIPRAGISCRVDFDTGEVILPSGGDRS